jgi:type I restriction enzyme, S subunit
MTVWPTVPFLEALVDQSGGNVKTLQSDYLESGRFPIVDQGKDLVGGYSDDPTSVCRTQPPALVFGDHTRALKYVDFPFGMGADGVKVLHVRDGFDPKFVFHYLRSLDIPSAGYSRHFKFLKERRVPRPPLDEQRRIAAILDQADGLRAKRREALALLDDLTQATFLNLFGDPVKNPRGWPITTLTQLGQLDRGVSRHRPRNDPSLLGGRHPLVQTGEVANSGGYIRRFTGTYSDVGLAQSKKWPAGTLCITIAANIAKTGILTFDACFPDSVVGFTSERATTQYVRVWLGFLQATLERAAPQSAQKNINLAILRNLPIPKPPVESIEQFARNVERLEEAKDLATAHAEGVDGLFASLQSRAFVGGL